MKLKCKLCGTRFDKEALKLCPNCGFQHSVRPILVLKVREE
jgi:rRNA maturation endonuclease Nob1